MEKKGKQVVGKIAEKVDGNRYMYKKGYFDNNNNPKWLS